MILSASTISVLQACPRRFLLEADWLVIKWRAKALFDACLRTAILEISAGKSPAEAAKDAKSQFLQVAANPGLDLPYGTDSYKVAKDYSAMLDTILRAAARWNLPKLAEHPAVVLNSAVSWQPLAAVDEAGELHRFITLDRWTDADLSRELHGWGVFGDVAITGKPMTIHVVEVGQIRNGRRSSAWARAWKHPTMGNTMKIHFAHKDGSTFKGWTPYYLMDHPDEDIDAWVEVMYKEGVAQRLVQHVGVAVPPQEVCDDTRRQVMQEATRARVLLSERSSTRWNALPMSRGACDGFVPCPWQAACHQAVTDLATTGLYQIKTKAMLAVA
jgi:hypothetical protein